MIDPDFSKIFLGSSLHEWVSLRWCDVSRIPTDKKTTKNTKRLHHVVIVSKTYSSISFTYFWNPFFSTVAFISPERSIFTFSDIVNQNTLLWLEIINIFRYFLDFTISWPFSSINMKCQCHLVLILTSGDSCSRDSDF